MCKTLGVSLDTSSVPKAKRRVERFFGILQSHPASELQLYNIQTFEEANLYLFDENFNKQFSLPLKNTQNAFEKLDKIYRLFNSLEFINRYLELQAFLFLSIFY